MKQTNTLLRAWWNGIEVVKEVDDEYLLSVEDFKNSLPTLKDFDTIYTSVTEEELEFITNDYYIIGV
jgi:hypothetical protein